MKYLEVIKFFNKGYGKYKRQIVALVGLGLFSGFLEGVGVNALVPLFTRLTGEGKADDFISGVIATFFDKFGLGLGLKVLIIFIVFAFITKAIVLLISKYITFKIAADYEQKTRSNLFRETLMARWPFLLEQKVGFLEQILMRDVYMSKLLLGHLSILAISIATLLVYIVIAFNISPIITLLSLSLGGVVFLILKPLFFRVRQWSNTIVKTNKEIAHHVNENILGLKTVKSGFVEEQIAKKANKYFNELKNVQLRINFFRDIPNVLMEPMSVVFVMAIFAFSYLATDFRLAVFAVTMYLIHRIFSRIQSVQSVISAMNESISYLKSVIDFNDKVSANREQYIGTKGFKFYDRLEFRDVSFSYNTEREILSQINFNVKAGEMVGFVGQSGAGKTTVVDLLLRLLELSGGQILVDDVDISEIDMKDWRKNIGYVSQDIFVINDTIENNIRFYDDTISEENIILAAKMAYIYDFIQNLPGGFKTQVGERGILLSGGEKQRLVLARVLARCPRILILDEATSALDNESELMIQRAIEDLKGKTTIFVIAHRLSTLLNCDKILVLDSGRISEEGLPQTLLEDKESYFYKIYNIRGG